MECNKRAMVFVPNNINPPPGEFLGIEKIISSGSFLWFCVDGKNREDYPSGWLAIVDKNGTELEKNIDMASGAGTSFGFNPFFGLDSPLPFWLWLLILGVGILYLTKE